MDATQGKSEFPMTVWPGFVVPAPRVCRQDLSIEGGYFVWHDLRGQRSVSPVEEELYLHGFMELSLSAEHLAAFQHKHGWIVSWFDWSGFLDPVRCHGDCAAQLVLQPPHAPAAGIPVELTVLHVQMLRNAIRVSVMQDGLLSTEDVLEQWEGARHDWLQPLKAIPWAPPTMLSSVDETAEEWRSRIGTSLLRYLADVLNGGLVPFQVRVRLVLRGDDDSAMATELAPELHSLYPALCLQLANHIAERATYRRCANEKCRRFFVRQLGGAQFGQHHSTGVLYCSPQCARAQASRMVRRRKKNREQAERQA
jgi:hypothetical protein